VPALLTLLFVYPILKPDQLREAITDSI